MSFLSLDVKTKLPVLLFDDFIIKQVGYFGITGRSFRKPSVKSGLRDPWLLRYNLATKSPRFFLFHASPTLSYLHFFFMRHPRTHGSTPQRQEPNGRYSGSSVNLNQFFL
jgi:hypothetical protein